MNTQEKINIIVNNLPSYNIYELLNYEDIQIIEDYNLSKRKCESQIIIANEFAGIYITPNLKEDYKQFLLWHEFGHYKLHYDTNIKFNFYLSRYKNKSEVEANIFATLSILKNIEFCEDSNLLNLMINNGVPSKIAIYMLENINFKKINLAHESR